MNVPRIPAARSSAGFSLIELMIAMVAGLIVSYAALAFTMSSLKSNGEYLQSTQLTQELRNSLDLVTRELKRAGYDENALGYMSSGSASPFGPMLVSAAGTDSSCVLFGYDKAGGNAGQVDVGRGEVRGLRRVTANVNGRTVGIIEYGASSGTTRPLCSDDTTASYASFPAVCTGVWCPLSDPSKINITRFRLNNATQSTGVGTNVVRIRNLGVEIRARQAGDDGTSYLNGVSESYERAVSSAVKVRSECARKIIAQCDLSP
jgi:prepilin-type N-terminal cleavage/methylation domain-containing protein